MRKVLHLIYQDQLYAALLEIQSQFLVEVFFGISLQVGKAAFENHSLEECSGCFVAHRGINFDDWYVVTTFFDHREVESSKPV
jgi:hypothetical protein